MNVIEKALFNEYVKHWDLIADSSVKVMEELIQASEAIQRVRKLHAPDKENCCTECREELNDEWNWVEYPCPTIQALDGEQ